MGYYNMNMNFENARKYIETTYSVIEYVEGHYKYVGKDAGVMKNPMWRVLNENGSETILMHCQVNTLCKLCPESYKRIVDYERNLYNNKKITWFKAKNGYIAGTNKLFMHQTITNCYGNGKGTHNISVDHIDRDILNNDFDNLRIATRLEQEQNTKGIIPDTKRARKWSAKQLPDGLTQYMLKKYFQKKFSSPPCGGGGWGWCLTTQDSSAPRSNHAQQSDRTGTTTMDGASRQALQGLQIQAAGDHW